MRTGLIARKVGMSSIFDADGASLAITLLHALNRVVAHRTKEKDGYSALQLGMAGCKVKNRPVLEYFKKNKMEPLSVLSEFRVSEDNFIDLGVELGVSHFEVGSYVDVKGITIGKGFAGTMKRHNFKGLFATHGVSISHRSQGSTGQCQDPGRTFKGKKMAGQLGSSRVTQQNLRVIRIDERKNIICLLGAVPGHKNSFVRILPAVKKSVVVS